MGLLITRYDNYEAFPMIKIFNVFLIIIGTIGLSYLAYTLCLKDLIILLKEKQR